MGFEPTTLGLGSQCSTTELISHFVSTHLPAPYSWALHCKDK